MRTLERGGKRESLESMSLSIAQAYGFSSSPVTLSKKDLSGDTVTDRDLALIAALTGKMQPTEAATCQAWGTAKRGGGTAIVFAAMSSKMSVAQAFVVKAALGVAESSGLQGATVLISSVGDPESRKRYVREIGNFFKKNAKDVPGNVLELSAKDPDGALKSLADSDHPLAENFPRTIDHLSEASRKIMIETIALFEKLGIKYELEPRLSYEPGVSRELVFAIAGTNHKGERVEIARGGRIECAHGKEGAEVVGISVSVPEALSIDRRAATADPACFVVHVGEAAKLKAFTLLDTLWRAHITLGQALLAETITEQMERVVNSKAKYVAIIGQREALDDTVIIKNTATEFQETIPLSKLTARLSRVRT